VKLLTQALELDEHVRGSRPRDITRARWSRQIAQAWYYQDDYARAREWFERAVRRTGTQSRLPMLGALGALPVLLARGATVDHRDPAMPEDEVERTIEAIRSMRELAAVYLWQTDQTAFVANALSMASAARRIGGSSESAYAVCIFAYLLSLLGMRKRAERESAIAERMAEESGDLLQITATNTARGMVMTNHGRFEAAATNLARAEIAAEELRAGPYKHRSKFMFAETLFWLGRYDHARRLYDVAATLSIQAEPHVGGLGNCMAALTLLRQGRVDEALERLERPDAIALVRAEGVVLSLVCGLGALAEARLAAGDPAGALEAVREAEASVRPGDDGTNYFAGILGHAALARVRILTGDEGEPRGWPLSRTRLDWLLGRVRKLVRFFPGGRPRMLYVEGLRDLVRGRTERARSALYEAVEYAEKWKLPWELTASALALATIEDGKKLDRLLRIATRAAESAGIDIDVLQATPIPVGSAVSAHADRSLRTSQSEEHTWVSNGS
jgi:tetratricopeptide (TPR) repeat protein